MAFGCSPSIKLPSITLKEIPFTDPAKLFFKVYQICDYAFLLESIEGPEKLARYSFIGFNPLMIIKVKNGKAVIQKRERNIIVKAVKDPLSLIKALIKKPSLKNYFSRFIGGFVGYISYDTVRYWEKLPENAVDDLNFPDVEGGLFNDCVIFDHYERRAFYYCIDGENNLKIIKNAKNLSFNNEKIKVNDVKLNFTRTEYNEAVKKAKKYIKLGDVFQVVLSKRYEFNIEGDLTRFYLALKKMNPSPYMFFLKMGKRQLIGSSPEMLVRIENRMIETFPIAGTRPRGKTIEEDKKLAKELLSDLKERAEHIMLVDLARNDIGKVSEFGSVKVPEFMVIHRYSHVQHIVSKVIGKLRKDLNCYDALKAVFPAGTVSGAPKIRAMEIIDELEPNRRGPYAGAVGYFSYNENMDFAITIRTLVVNEDKGYIQSGSGIVADSSPKKEWFETEHKAKALLKALKASLKVK
ncbi:MAG: anthranilate synthase component I [Candidatus Bathyarchaeia archaeon]